MPEDNIAAQQRKVFDPVTGKQNDEAFEVLYREVIKDFPEKEDRIINYYDIPIDKLESYAERFDAENVSLTEWQQYAYLMLLDRPLVGIFREPSPIPEYFSDTLKIYFLRKHKLILLQAYTRKLGEKKCYLHVEVGTEHTIVGNNIFSDALHEALPEFEALKGAAWYCVDQDRQTFSFKQPDKGLTGNISAQIVDGLPEIALTYSYSCSQ